MSLLEICQPHQRIVAGLGLSKEQVVLLASLIANLNVGLHLPFVSP